MALVKYQTAGFGNLGSFPVPPPVGLLQVTRPELIRGAITVGATPVALGEFQRPLLELCWRASMAASSLMECGRQGWCQTPAYHRLDPSEKSAVSYFLGMVQAKLTCEALLGAPHLVHLDAIAAILGLPVIRRTRPDLLGIDLVTMKYTLAVEAKGRSGGLDRKAVRSAKAQARSLPNLTGTPSALRVASLAYFERGAWCAYLEDPEPAVDELSDQFTTDLLFVAYYRPLAAALRTDGVRIYERSSDDENLVRGGLPGMDLTLGLPQAIIDAFADDQLTGPLDAFQVGRIGTTLREVVLALRDRPERSAEGQDIAASTGQDGVLVELGQSWLANDLL